MNQMARLVSVICMSVSCMVCGFTARGLAEEPYDALRPPAVVTEQVPVVPQALVDRLEKYQQTRSAGFDGWDPAGQGILINTRFGPTSQLHRVFAPGGRRQQVSFFAEPTYGSPLPAAQDGALLAIHSAGGNENNQIYLLDSRTGSSQRLTDGTSRHSLHAVSSNGRRMVVGSNRRNGRDTDLLLMDPRNSAKTRTLLETTGEYWVGEDLAPGTQTALLMRQYVSINETYPALLTWKNDDGDSQQVQGVKQTLIPPPPGTTDKKVSVGSMSFAPDGKHAWLSSDALGEFRALALLNLESMSYVWPAPNLPGDVESLVVEPTSGMVAFTINHAGTSQLYLLKPGKLDGDAGDHQVTRVDLPRGIVSSLEFSPAGAHLGFTLSQPDAPSEAYSLRIRPEEEKFPIPAGCEVRPGLVRWTFSEVGPLDPATFVTSQPITFKSFDDREIPADYYRPRRASAKRPVAVLISIHGGPESQSRPYFSGTDQFYVNELGIAVIKPNVRGSNGYGKTYLRLDNAQLREDSVRDIGALLDWIEKQDELDASRVAVIGGSYGGYMVLSSLMHYSDRLTAGVDIVGVASFASFLKNTSAYRRDLRRAEYGDERDPAMQAYFAKVDPAQNADRIRAALLVAHGRNDPRVPFSEAEQVVTAVKKNGQRPWTVYADNEGHGFAKKPNRDYLTAVIALFLQQHLQP